MFSFSEYKWVLQVHIFLKSRNALFFYENGRLLANLQHTLSVELCHAAHFIVIESSGKTFLPIILSKIIQYSLILG